MTDKEKATFNATDLTRVMELHDALDAAVFAAYDWPDDLTRAQIVARLTRLNQLRARDERDGKILWLRPEQRQE